MTAFTKSRAVSCALLLASCADDGAGAARFTTWGEEFVEEQIPADPEAGGFVDGWSLKYEKFLVVFHGITVADERGRVGARQVGSYLVDNVLPGRKELVLFEGLDARRWSEVSYQIRPADVGTTIASPDHADDAALAFMKENGYALYIAGAASKGSVTKTFHWGFSTATQYAHCQHAVDSGRVAAGLVITNGGVDTSELTTHGDHFFYDRLQSSPDPAVQTSLRFEEKAAADADDDGEVTLDELFAADIDITLYNPSPFDAPTYGDFVTALARTVGHFRGEGECSVSVQAD